MNVGECYLTKSNLLTLAVFLCAANLVDADAIYQVAVNTSSIAGVQGSIEFQFAAGIGETQDATVKLLNFTGGTLGIPTYIGEVTGGPLPAALTIGNGIQTNNVFNDLFETFTYGKLLTFTLDVGGPAVTAPNGLSTGNSLLVFLMYSDKAGNVPVLTNDPNGVAALVRVNPNGSVGRAALSPEVSFVPEPGSVWLIGGALGILIGGRKRFTNRVG